MYRVAPHTVVGQDLAAENGRLKEQVAAQQAEVAELRKEATQLRSQSDTLTSLLVDADGRCSSLTEELSGMRRVRSRRLLLHVVTAYQSAMSWLWCLCCVGCVGV